MGANDQEQPGVYSVNTLPEPSASSKELREAWNELHCCDDIPLDQGLAAGIGYLQADREELRREHRKAVDDLCKWRSAIQAMTPGGSEFMHPDAVRRWAEMLKRENAELKLALAWSRKDLAAALSGRSEATITDASQATRPLGSEGTTNE